MKTRKELDRNIEKLVYEGDFNSIVGTYDSGNYITEIRDEGDRIQILTDGNLGAYINKGHVFTTDLDGWVEYIKYNS
jgi:hypothetical protein